MTKENPNTEIVNWKELHLITPEGAKRWDVDTEAPQLFSPTLAEDLRCRGCKHFYRPLVYQPGIVEADQFCDQDCGIYFQSGTVKYFSNWVGVRGSWVAIVEPVGQIANSEPNSPVKRAGAVLVTQIKGICAPGEKRHLIDSGVLVPSYRPDLLIPYCEDHYGSKDRAVFRFKSTDNGLVFSHIKPPRRYFL